MKRFDGYFIDKDQDGLGDVLALGASARELDVPVLVRKHHAAVIRLSEYVGWHDSDLSFLPETPRIRGVEIMSENVTDLTPIQQLAGIELLALWCPARGVLNFLCFNKLRILFLVWRKAFESVFALTTMANINIVDYPAKDLTVWKRMGSLRKLKLSSAKLQSLEGIQSFANLKSFTLFQCRKVESLRPLETVRSIEGIKLEKCSSIGDLSPVAKLENLRELAIIDGGQIGSLAPIANCKKLEFLQVAGNTTVTDGDFTPLTTLPRLKKVLLRNRKHYTHTAHDLERAA